MAVSRLFTDDEPVTEKRDHFAEAILRGEHLEQSLLCLLVVRVFGQDVFGQGLAFVFILRERHESVARAEFL
ncbi:MAG: hypothetical protein KAI47_27090, partial [Deltaproteobacteria bacterium]|nr:hypothetical protein [Deltaproteobacteria bacterium]